MEPYVGQIQAFGFNFAPKGWAVCDGQLLPISQNTALYSLLGTTYGGDGKTTFALPDLRGRSILGHGHAPGLSQFVLGQEAGKETETLTTSNMPAHNHMVTATDSDADSDEASNGSHLGTAGANIYASSGAGTVHLAADSTTQTGANAAFNIRDPFLGVNYCIAIYGSFPPRS